MGDAQKCGETAGSDLGNRGIARFYSWAHWLYPLVEPFLKRARSRLIAAVNEQPPGTLLEIGVGTGSHLRRYRSRRITAVDISPGMVRRASPRAALAGAGLKVMDGEKLVFADASFDQVVLAFVLSVTSQPERMLAEAWRVLRPGGFAYVLNHETAPSPPWLVVAMRKLLRLQSRFTLKGIPGWPESSVVRREACPPIGWFTFVVLPKP